MKSIYSIFLGFLFISTLFAQEYYWIPERLFNKSEKMEIPLAPIRNAKPIFTFQSFGMPVESNPPKFIIVNIDDQGRPNTIWNGRLLFMGADGKLDDYHQIPGQDWENFINELKYRNGNYYKRNKQTIYKFENGGWDAILSPVTYFSNFEILENDDIVLINTGVPPRFSRIPEHPAWFRLGSMLPGTSNFIELWAPRAQGPYKTISYPEDLEILNEKWTLGILGCESTNKIGSRYLLYFREIAQLWIFDAIEQKVQRAVLPWGSIDKAFLEPFKKWASEGCWGCLDVNVSYFPGLIVFPLALDEVFIGTFPPRPLKVRFETEDQMARKRGKRAVPPPKLWEEEEARKDWLPEAVVLDLSSLRTRKVTLEFQGGRLLAGNEAWFFGDGSAVSIKKMIRAPETENQATGKKGATQPVPPKRPKDQRPDSIK